MKKRVLCYGDSNTWGFNAMNENVYGQRFPEEVRWTGRLQTLLGENWTAVSYTHLYDLADSRETAMKQEP